MLAVHEEAFGGDPEPNPAHRALATLERLGYLDAVIPVDRSPDSFSRERRPTDSISSSVDRYITQNADRLHQLAGSEEVLELPPTCTDCGDPLKPDGVLFGEQLPESPLYRASALSEKCDVFLAAGSSLTVEPAASLPETAVDHGATPAVVTLDPTPPTCASGAT